MTLDGTSARLLIEDGPSQELKDLTHVRITAIVKSDDRVTYDAPRQDSAACSQTITETIRSSKFRWVKRDASSAHSGEGTGEIRNDAANGGPMEELGLSLREQLEPLDQGVSFTIPWVELAYRPGDRIKEIDGRDVSFRARAGDKPSFPMIETVTYDFQSQQTGLEVRPPVA